MQQVYDDDGLADIRDTILRCQTINLPNALSLNDALISQLKGLLARLNESVAKCQAKFDENVQLLAQLDETPTTAREPSTSLFNEKIVQPMQLFGYPYFKTRSGKFAAPNPEAAYRRSQKALYPYDLNCYTRVEWTMADKSVLLHSIRELMLKYASGQKTVTVPAVQNNLTMAKLMDLVRGLPFKINWVRVSDMCSSRHSPAECEAMWQLNLHPRLKRSRWTDEQDDALLAAGREFKFQNWEKIAAKMDPPRSMFQCFVHYQTSRSGQRKEMRDKYSPEEDRRILELVQESKVGSIIPWRTIALSFPHRTKTSVYHRYMYTLRPNISREKFSVEEDCIFLAALQEYGLNFHKISAELPNRTTVQLKSHYYSVLKRNKEVTPWTLAADEQLVRLHGEGKTWAQIAQTMKDHDRIMCRTRFQTIQNFLKRHPKKTLKDVFRRARVARNGVTTDNWATKLTEISRKLHEDKPSFSQTEVLKLASFVRLLDVTVNEELIAEFEQAFTAAEVAILRAVITQDEKSLLDFPMHKPTLVAFDGIRGCLAKEQPMELATPIESNVERENFKKQFKALFYLPAVLASIKPDTSSTTIATQFGPVTITY